MRLQSVKAAIALISVWRCRKCRIFIFVNDMCIAFRFRNYLFHSFQDLPSYFEAKFKYSAVAILLRGTVFAISGYVVICVVVHFKCSRGGFGPIGPIDTSAKLKTVAFNEALPHANWMTPSRAMRRQSLMLRGKLSTSSAVEADLSPLLWLIKIRVEIFIEPSVLLLLPSNYFKFKEIWCKWNNALSEIQRRVRETNFSVTAALPPSRSSAHVPAAGPPACPRPSSGLSARLLAFPPLALPATRPPAPPPARLLHASFTPPYLPACLLLRRHASLPSHRPSPFTPYSIKEVCERYHNNNSKFKAIYLASGASFTDTEPVQ